MAVTLTTPNTILGVLAPKSQTAKLISNIVIVVLGTALITLAAKINVPTWPVPVTLQSFAIAALAAAFGARIGVATVALYLLEGAAGLPVFAGTPEKGIGLAYMAGPTGGYLVGFLLAAVLLGALAERGWDRSILRTTLAMSLGHAVMLACGVVWLATLIGWPKAIAFGLTPFWMATVLKTGLGVAVLPAAWKLVKRLER
jgi:biotin transport system substrate-specific component